MYPSNYKEIFFVFLKMGFTAFGGPAAHVGMMEQEIIEKRKWVSKQEFLDMVGVTNIIPGPNSTELVILLSLRRGGVMGMILGGFAFITPPLLMVLLFAFLYVEYGNLPALFTVLYGIKPIVFSIVFLALLRLWKNAIKIRWMIIVLLMVILFSFLGVHELLVMLFGGMAVLGVHLLKTRKVLSVAFPLLILAADAEILRKIFFNFLKIGSILYGGGYVLLVFIESDFVDRLGLISNAQLLDAIAVGQLTPGPLFTTATFIGYLLGGVVGALLGTLGIFLPSFMFVGLLHKFLPVMQKNVYLRQFLNGVIIASLGLMIVVLYHMFGSAVVDVFTGILLITSFVAMYKYRVNPAYMIVIGGLLGYIYHLI